ncbi:hypothetical protein Thermus77412_23570 [Thermus antranikianii]
MARAMKWIGVVIRTAQGGSVDYLLFPALGEARGWARKEKMGEAVPFPQPRWLFPYPGEEWWVGYQEGGEVKVVAVFPKRLRALPNVHVLFRYAEHLKGLMGPDTPSDEPRVRTGEASP